MSVIRQEAALIAEIMKRGSLPEGLRYASPLDLVVAEGREFAPVLAEERGPSTSSSRNAGSVALFDDPDRYAYVEGFAVPAEVPLPMAHAWLWDRVEKRAVETTWDKVGAEYLGVAFRTDWFRAWTKTREVWGVFDVRIMLTVEANPAKYAESTFLEKIPPTPCITSTNS